MKQLKFRAWIKPQKKMLPVIDLHWDYDGELESCLIEGASKNDYGDTERGIYVPITECELMQFTGLYDKNGKEIYEGDMLKFIDIFGENRVSEVKTIDKLIIASYFSITQQMSWNKTNEDWITESREIIGNIYENKELLK